MLWRNPVKRRIAEEVRPEAIKAENLWCEADYLPALDGNGWIGRDAEGSIFRLEPNGTITRLAALALLCLANLSAGAQTPPTMTVTITPTSKSVTMPDSNTVKATINFAVSALIRIGGGGGTPPPSCTVNVTGNASIQTAITTAGASGVVCLHGTFTGQTFSTLNNITLRGDGASSTIIDGGGLDAQMTNGNNDGATGVTIDSVTIKNYGGNANFVTWNGWTVKNSTLRDGVNTVGNPFGTGVYILGGGVTIQNNLITNNQHKGIGGALDLTGTTTASHVVIIGNEISFNNTLSGLDGDAAGVKILWGTNSTGAPLDFTNNYVHDNKGPAVWCDGGAKNWTVQGNTLIGNYDEGIMFETCLTADISHNVINNSGINHTADNLGSAVYISSAGNANVHDNNVLVGIGHGQGINIQEDTRSDDANGCVNDTIHNNTVTFLGNGGSGFGNQGLANYRGCTLVGDSSNNNAFYVASGSHIHWSWPPMGQYAPAIFSTYKSTSGQDAASTLTVGNASVAGCLMIGCAGSGW